MGVAICHCGGNVFRTYPPDGPEEGVLSCARCRCVWALDLTLVRIGWGFCPQQAEIRDAMQEEVVPASTVIKKKLLVPVAKQGKMDL